MGLVFSLHASSFLFAFELRVELPSTSPFSSESKPIRAGFKAATRTWVYDSVIWVGDTEAGKYPVNEEEDETRRVGLLSFSPSLRASHRSIESSASFGGYEPPLHSPRPSQDLLKQRLHPLSRMVRKHWNSFDASSQSSLKLFFISSLPRLPKVERYRAQKTCTDTFHGQMVR